MTSLLPTPQQWFDNNGQPLANGTVGYYIPNTLSFKTVWADPNQQTSLPNPVPLDAGGRVTVYGAGIYREIVKDSLGATIADQLTTSYLSEAAISATMAPVTAAATTATAVNLLGIPTLISTAIDNVQLLPGPTGPIGPVGGIGPTGPTGPTTTIATFTAAFDVTSSRALSKTFTNATGKPMWVSVNGQSTGGSAGLKALVNGNWAATATSATATGEQMGIGMMVPAGATYSVEWYTSFVTLNHWTETW